VVNDVITAQDARDWSSVMGGRRPVLWDNTPVNDAVMTSHLFTGPLRGRDPHLPGELAGYLANPMVQARPSLAPLLSAAAWLRGEDPSAAWRAVLGEDRVFLEGCDGEVPALLAAAGLGGDQAALADLEAWFAAAEECGAGSLGDGVEPWVERLHDEARVGRLACQLLRADPDEAAAIAPILYLMWPVRGTHHQVLGGRGSLVPALGQDRRSRWTAAGSSMREGEHLVDRLVAAVFAGLP
jgi:hypothetical protein